MNMEERQRIAAYDEVLPQLTYAMSLYRQHELNLAHERRKAAVMLEAMRYRQEVRRGTLGGIMQRLGDGICRFFGVER